MALVGDDGGDEVDGGCCEGGEGGEGGVVESFCGGVGAGEISTTTAVFIVLEITTNPTRIIKNATNTNGIIINTGVINSDSNLYLRFLKQFVQKIAK